MPKLFQFSALEAELLIWCEVRLISSVGGMVIYYIVSKGPIPLIRVKYIV